MEVKRFLSWVGSFCWTKRVTNGNYFWDITKTHDQPKTRNVQLELLLKKITQQLTIVNK
jgi:hypothetical protein